MQTGYTAQVLKFRFSIKKKAFKWSFSPYDQDSVFIVFLRLWFNIVWISSRATALFSWKAWMYKLVTFGSHDQLEFNLISQIFYSIDPRIFQGKLAFCRSRRILFSQFSSLWTRQANKLFTLDFRMVFPTSRGKHDYLENTVLLVFTVTQRENKIKTSEQK